MQVAGGSSGGFLPENVTLAVAAFAGVSPTTSESGPWVMTVTSAWPTSLPSPSRHVTTALVVPLIHVKVVSPPAVQVTESVGLAAATGAARIAEATAVASSIPIRSFFIVFMVVLAFSPLPSPFGANPSSGVVHVPAVPTQAHTAATAVYEGITSRTRYSPRSRRIRSPVSTGVGRCAIPRSSPVMSWTRMELRTCLNRATRDAQGQYAAKGQPEVGGVTYSRSLF